MSCSTPINPMLELINDAFELAGVATNGTLSAVQSKKGIRGLNMILDSMGNAPMYIPYQFNMEIVATGAIEYIIGTAGDETHPLTIETNVPLDINTLTYNIGGATYVCRYMTPQAFDSIGIKNTQGLAQRYTFELRDTYTILRLYPVLQAGAVMNLTGKKRLNHVEYFTSADQLPQKLQMFFLYMLSSHLLALGFGKKNDRFDENFNLYTDIALDSNDDNFAMDEGTKPSSTGYSYRPSYG